MYGEDNPQPNEWPSGLLLAFALHLSQFLLGPITNWYSLWFLGVGQLLYILPAIFIYKRNNRGGMVKGLSIGASITFLLNTSCLAAFRDFKLR